MLKLKGHGSVKDIRKAQKKEEEQKTREGTWGLVIPDAFYTTYAWPGAGSDRYSPGRDTSGGYHLHVTHNGTKSGFRIVSAVYYTHANNAQAGGALNRQVDIDFHWDDDAQRIVVVLGPGTPLNFFHPNQRQNVQDFVAACWVMPLDHLD